MAPGQVCRVGPLKFCAHAGGWPKFLVYFCGGELEGYHLLFQDSGQSSV